MSYDRNFSTGENHVMGKLKRDMLEGMKKYKILNDFPVRGKNADLPNYFNVKTLMGYPNFRKIVSRIMGEKIDMVQQSKRMNEISVESSLYENREINFIAGEGVGGMPLAQAISDETGIPYTAIRKETKNYGPTPDKFLDLYIPKKGERGILAEDVINTGRTAIGNIMKTEEESGAKIEYVLGVVNRSVPKLQNIYNRPLYCITTDEEVLRFLK